MDSDAPDIVFEQLDLARVQPRADLDAEGSDALADGDGRADAPSRAASCVDPTMSVNRTVARTRSGSGAGRTPVTNSWISLTNVSWSPAQIRLSTPGNSTYFAAGMCVAR